MTYLLLLRSRLIEPVANLFAVIPGKNIYIRIYNKHEDLQPEKVVFLIQTAYQDQLDLWKKIAKTCDK